MVVVVQETFGAKSRRAPAIKDFGPNYEQILEGHREAEIQNSTCAVDTTTAMDYKQKLTSLEPVLRSNVAPLPQQSSDINSVISHLTEQLDGVESRIARLRDELSQLESSKAELQEEIGKYSSVLSAVRSIPPDIIRTIMLACYDEEAFDQRQVRDLALVSRQWYTVAIATPLLWSAYTIDATSLSTSGEPDNAGDDDGFIPDGGAILSQASVHFSRAMSRPISLGIFFDESQLPDDAVFDFVRDLAPRLGRIYVSLGVKKEKELDSILLRLIGQALVWPVLWDLDIELCMHEYTFVHNWCGGFFQGNSCRFPAVRRLRLRKDGEVEVAGAKRIQGWDMPWSQISHLFLGPLPMHYQDILNILDRCANLQEAVICITGSASSLRVEDTTDRTKPVELSNVLYFDLTTEDVEVSGSVLNRLSLPMLRRFAFGLNHKPGFQIPVCTHASREGEEIEEILRPLIKLFERSACGETLHDLQLDLAQGLGAIGYTPDNIEELFEKVPRLKQFKITGFDRLPSDLLEHLPLSVDHLEVAVKNSALDLARVAVAEFLVDHCRARQLANNGVPQEMKAKFMTWKDSRAERAKKLVRSLKSAEGEYASAAKLIADID